MAFGACVAYHHIVLAAYSTRLYFPFVCMHLVTVLWQRGISMFRGDALFVSY